MKNSFQLYLFDNLDFCKKENLNKDKDLIDDGFNAEFVQNAIFDGLLEIPLIKNPKEIVIPKAMIPFSEMDKSKNHSEFLCFYENDLKFRDILTSTKENLEKIKKFSGVISPDCSLYYDIPLVLQMTNLYLNHQIGHYFQEQGIYVIPNVRFGDERTYKRIISAEPPFAFLGLEKHGIYSIGTYGCCKSSEYKFHLREGLRSFIKEIEPKIILVYGAMPNEVFNRFKNCGVQFFQYDNWIKRQHEKSEVKNGKR